jgi:hypothetical protein
MDYVRGADKHLYSDGIYVIDESAHYLVFLIASDKREYPPDPTVKIYLAYNKILYQVVYQTGQTEPGLIEVANIKFILNESSCEWCIPLNLVPEISSRLSSGQDIVFLFLIEDARGGDFGDSGLLYYPSRRVVNDRTSPEISDLLRTPQNPVFGESITITCKVFDELSGIKEVNLYYSTNSGSSWIKVPLSLQGETYIGVIPSQMLLVNIQYYVEAIDNAGNTNRTKTLTFIVAMPIWLLAALILILGSTLLLLLRIVRRRPTPPLTNVEKEIKKYEEYLERLEASRKEGKISEKVYEKLKNEYEEKLDKLISKWKK